MKLYWTLACFALMTVLYLIYESIKWGTDEHKWQEWFFKGAATAMSALLAGYGYFSAPSPAHLLLLIGLCVCVAADIILDQHFLAGTAAFGLGHLCYCAAMLVSRTPGWVNLIAFAVLAAGALALYPQIKKMGKGQNTLPFLGYALLLCVLLALTVGQSPLLLAGAALFVLSDVMLLFRIVRSIPSKRYDYLCLGCYYLAQFMIAASTVF